MMWFPELPKFDGDCSGTFCLPEITDFDFHEGPSEDEFIKILIEVMSKPVRGGTNG